MRERLSDRRLCVLQKGKVDGHTMHVCVGLYEDGRPGEVFVDIGKEGTAVRSWSSSAAMLASLLLQHGAPLDEVVDALEAFPCPQLEFVARALREAVL